MHQNTNPNTSQQLPWAALIVLFAGLVLRMTLHDWHGLEGDDAFSLALSRYPISELVPGLFALQLDVHPPLHFLLLKYWVGLAGESLLSLRYLNILMDLLTGALMVGVIRLLKGRHIWIVALLWAASPLLIFGGWLARMYTLLGLWSVAALASVVWAGRGRWWLGVIAAAVCSLLAMYTHITGVLVGAAALCALVTLSLRALPRPASPAARLAGLAAIFASAAAIFAPFAVNVAGLYFSGASLGVSVNPANAVPPSAIPGAVLANVYAFRLGFGPGWLWAVITLGLLLIIARQLNTQPVLVFGLVAVGGLIALGVFAGFYKPRYVVPFAPLMLIWLGMVLADGLASASARWHAIGVLGVVVTVALLGARNLLPRDWRDDWTAAAAFIAAHDRSDDVVAVVPDWGQEAARYHYDGVAPVRGFFPQVGAGMDLDAAVGPYVVDARRFWAVRYQPEVSDPNGVALSWFDAHCPVAVRAFPAGASVALHVCEPRVAALPDGVTPAEIVFDARVVLRGYDVPVREAALDGGRLYTGSGRVLVTTYWAALTSAGDLTPRVQITAPSGAVYGGALPSVARVPTGDWEVGAIYELIYDVNLNPTTPPGVYNVEVTVLGANGVLTSAAGPGAGATWFIAGQVSLE